MSRRRQKWQEQRAQGFGPGLQHNLVDAEHPQAPAVAPAEIEARPVLTFNRIGPVIDAIERIEISPAGDPCPKCGRPLKKQGRHFHLAKCQGVAA